ncbi:MAG: hypothetical protein KatS3mg105_1482 [Gemmatales bacterium]|nr:MAG: hypothetical protein KatS3mg105_1482 [Gemmatales bacterium]
MLDEPTTGLHFDDLRKLLEVLNRLVDLGNTVIVVEHNMDVIKTADWIIDMGPEAGDSGGYVVAVGTPEEVAATADKTASGFLSHTGRILRDVLRAGSYCERIKYDPHAADQKREGDVDLEEVGAEAKMPWQTDGHRWHTVDRTAATGAPCRWEGAILDWLNREIHRRGLFSPTNWNHRTQVEIAAPTKSHGWFLHASTCYEWLVWLTFRVRRGHIQRGRAYQSAWHPTSQ